MKLSIASSKRGLYSMVAGMAAFMASNCISQSGQELMAVAMAVNMMRAMRLRRELTVANANWPLETKGCSKLKRNAMQAVMLSCAAVAEARSNSTRSMSKIVAQQVLAKASSKVNLALPCAMIGIGRERSNP